jgi:hypothetical protein
VLALANRCAGSNGVVRERHVFRVKNCSRHPGRGSGTGLAATDIRCPGTTRHTMTIPGSVLRSPCLESSQAGRHRTDLGRAWPRSRARAARHGRSSLLDLGSRTAQLAARAPCVGAVGAGRGLVDHRQPARAAAGRVPAQRSPGHDTTIVAAARRLAVLFWCLLHRDQDTRRQPSLTPRSAGVLAAGVEVARNISELAGAADRLVRGAPTQPRSQAPTSVG